MKKLLMLVLFLFVVPDAQAGSADLGVHITSSSTAADKWVKLTSSSTAADKWVKVVGNCYGKGDTWVKLTTSSTAADEWWRVTESYSAADMTICLSGDIEEWYKHSP